MVNVITGTSETGTLTKRISDQYESKFDSRICNSNQNWNNNECRCEGKKHRICKKDYIWNPVSCCCKNGKYLACIIDDSVITCNEVIKETKTIPTIFNEKNIICKTKSFYILLTSL